MLTTPKFLVETLSSPATASSSSSSSATTFQSAVSAHADDEMLTTPIITTPKTADLWPKTSTTTTTSTSPSISGPSRERGLNLIRGDPASEKCDVDSDQCDVSLDVLPLTFSPSSLSSSSRRRAAAESSESPPTSSLLPLDSDIGLRSPCDGLLAKRRKYKLKQASSINSDSNSNDTNSAQNSPRDLSLSHKSLNQVSQCSQSNDETHDDPGLMSDQGGGMMLSRGRVARTSSSRPLSSHYSPSPLAVPSPNWSAVERYFGGQDMNKTPKLLDNNVFDFLGPPPITPRGKLTSRENRSPNGLEFQRLSPRFPIPETPTDLSGKLDEQDNDHQAAQDLSMRAPQPDPKQPLVVVKTEFVDSNDLLSGRRGNYLLSLSTLDSKMESKRSVSPASSYLPANRLLTTPKSTTRSHSASPPSKRASSREESLSRETPATRLRADHGPSSVFTVTAVSVADTDLILVPVARSTSTSTSTSGTSGLRAARSGSSSSRRRRAPRSKKASSKSEVSNEEDVKSTKRVYTCPHCQRTYDWNYNLNRHLKYECGKENAFQCSKCGRKFPHKQNCVYHLKRKHKIVCDSIEEYMSSGLVLFRGAVDVGNKASGNNNRNERTKKNNVKRKDVNIKEELDHLQD